MSRDSRKAPERHVATTKLRESFYGCLLGGAVGDALGAPVEFMSDQQILERFGKTGIRDFVPAYGRIGAVTDDTQMMLFTAEGLLRALVRSQTKGICHPPALIAYAYLRWLHTQGVSHPLHSSCLDGWLIGHRDLHSRRAPGSTCLSALQALTEIGVDARNNSKGCGGVMRVAPVGMLAASLATKSPETRQFEINRAFELGCQTAGLTHGHPTGKLAAGALSSLICQLLLGANLHAAVEKALPQLSAQRESKETSDAVRKAVRLARERPNTTTALRELGEGWVAEEALAIGLYCALSASDFESGVVLAVNHGGDSDSTGLIALHLLGSIHGLAAIPSRWLQPLELRDVLEEVADDLATAPDWKVGETATAESEYYSQRYPGR